ncbi:ABC transporter permease, partial [Brachyspira hyodysenteriae]
MENSLDKSLFVKATDEEKASAEVKRESVTYWQDAYRRFKKNRVALISIIVIGVIAILSIIIPMVSEYGYAQINRGVENSLPTLEHPFGTDTLGRDLLVRCMIGARISLLIGIVSATLVVIIGIVYGSISGYFGGLADSIMMRIVDIISAVPTLLVVVLLSVVLKAPMDKLFLQNESLRGIGLLGPGLFSIFIVISLLYWTNMAR